MKKAWKLKYGDRFLDTKDIKETILPGKVSIKLFGFKVQTVEEIIIFGTNLIFDCVHLYPNIGFLKARPHQPTRLNC